MEEENFNWIEAFIQATEKKEIKNGNAFKVLNENNIDTNELTKHEKDKEAGVIELNYKDEEVKEVDKRSFAKGALAFVADMPEETMKALMMAFLNGTDVAANFTGVVFNAMTNQSPAMAEAFKNGNAAEFKKLVNGSIQEFSKYLNNEKKQVKAIGEGSVIKSSKALIQAGFDPAANKAKIDGLFKENIEAFNKGGEAKGRVAKDIAKNYMPLMKFYATRSQPKTGRAAFSTLDGFNMDTYLGFAQTELEIHIMNFDQTQNDSMDGWIMAQAYNKSLNALNDLGIDIQVDQSLLDEANAILSTDLDVETAIDRQPQTPKRKRRDLIKDILNGKDLEPLVKDVIEKSFEENIFD